MAELAIAGGAVGFVSLGIQSCEGLAKYYSDYKSYDEEIGCIYYQIEELKTVCENLRIELGKRGLYHEAIVQQVARLIVSSQGGIERLKDALDQCHSAGNPQTLAAKLQRYRSKAAYPFKKQTLQELKNTVQSTQGILQSALQILQLHISAGVEQGLASLVTTSSNTETIVRDSQAAIQALSLPLSSINQAIPFVRQQTEHVATNIGIVHSEVRDLRQSVLSLRTKGYKEFANLAQCVESSAESIETTICRRLDSYGAEMDRLRQEMDHTLSIHTRKQAEKIEALDQSIKSLQIGLISQPSLLQSVAEEHGRFETFPRQDRIPRLQDKRRVMRRTCTCASDSNRLGHDTLTKGSRFVLWRTSKWLLKLETLSSRHQPSCPLFSRSIQFTTARFSVRTCGDLLAGAIEASLSIKKGAGGLSISPKLQCARVVPNNNPASQLVTFANLKQLENIRSISDFETLLYGNLVELERLFNSRDASPFDVDLDGNTFFHLASSLNFTYKLKRIATFYGLPKISLIELICDFYKKLGELCVPLNWTNAYNLTFLEKSIFNYPGRDDRHLLSTLVTHLLNIGADLPSTSSHIHISFGHPCYIFAFTDSIEILEALGCSELIISVLYQSRQLMIKALQDWPASINHANMLGQTPLHLAVGWPFGLQMLLEHHACIDPHDLQGRTPLQYAIQLGVAESVGLLMRARCDLSFVDSFNLNSQNPFTAVALPCHISQSHSNLKYSYLYGWPNWDMEEEFYEEVFKMFVISLAERRRNLQRLLAASSVTNSVRDYLYQNDRVLDKYAPYAEQLLETYNPSLLRVSTLLKNLRTVYHLQHLTVAIANVLWQNGFRDVDVPSSNGRTPLMIFGPIGNNLKDEIEIIDWLIQKGANLQQPQHPLSNVNFDMLMEKTDSSLATRAVHWVGARIGDRAGDLRYNERMSDWLSSSDTSYLHLYRRLEKNWRQHVFRVLSESSRQFLATIPLDSSRDQCICACSYQGCLALTMMLKAFSPWFYLPLRDGRDYDFYRLVAIGSLVNLAGPDKVCVKWLWDEIIRFHTFHKLQLRHTCCRLDIWHVIKELDPEETNEIRDEDRQGIQLLESLLQEFEEERAGQDPIAFLDGYWTTRMDQVCQARGKIDQEKLRELGVVLHQDESEESDIERIEEIG